MTWLPSEHGQTLVLNLVFLVVLFAVTAGVLDLGSWYRTDRATEAAADAAALAGAQALPGDAETAGGLARTYAQRNGGGESTVSFETQARPNDTITVALRRPAEGFFSRLLGIHSVAATATASAQVGPLSAATSAAPFAVDVRHRELSGRGCPCFGRKTTLDLRPSTRNASVLALDGSAHGVAQAALAGWIAGGYPASVPLGRYAADPGAPLGSPQVQRAMRKRLDTALLIPVYNRVTGTGPEARYTVAGWVGFRPTGFKFEGTTGEIEGYFTDVVWDGTPAASDEPALKFGARTVELVG